MREITMKIAKLCAISAIALSPLMTLAAAIAQQPRTITVAVEGAFAPYNFKDASGKLDGLEVELIPDLCRRMNVTCNIVQQSWAGIIPGLQTGKYDAIVSSMTITEQRKKAVLFSAEYARNSVSFATLKSNPLASLTVGAKDVDLSQSDADTTNALKALADAMKGKTIGVNRSTTNETLAKYLLKDTATINSYDNSENVALDLMSGRVDAVVISRAQLVLLMKRSDQVIGIGPPIHGGPLGGGMAAAVRQDNQPLADMFSSAIKGAIEDGTIKTLSVKWLGFDVTPRDVTPR
jgi:octopine/nopaline transport system substrate-binding protein